MMICCLPSSTNSLFYHIQSYFFLQNKRVTLLRPFIACLFLLFVFFIQTAHATSVKSKTIAYFERGNFWLYTKSYKSLQEALHEIPVACAYPKALHVSPGWHMNEAQMDVAALSLLNSDADIIIAAGTSAVNALLRVTDGQKPIVGIALADPVASGFMQADGLSLHPSFVAEVFPNRWSSMYQVFHAVIGFKRLGLMYPQGAEGRIYAAVDDAFAVAKEKNFSIIEAIIPDESPESCRQGIEELHKKGADSFFMSPLVCFDWSEHDPSALLKLIHEYNMSSFARDGSPFVQGGALMGFATWDFTPSARRVAKAILDIFHGVKPHELRLVVTPEPQIALNLQVAKELDIVFPFDLLLSADQIYEKTSPPNME